jgi:hypothetical protein
MFAVGLLLLQAGIQLLHHHYSDSYHDSKDGFHTLSTAVTCPANSSHSKTHTDTFSLQTSPFVFFTHFIPCKDLVGTDIEPLFPTTPVPGVQSRASPV